MPCYKPLRAYIARTPNGGKSRISFKPKRGYEKLPLPCGRCIGCRLERSRQWATRIMHEASLHDANCFITLTYNADHLPSDNNLNPKHFVDFAKRLRWEERLKKIRLFACGEYGEKFSRPHYHACLFGIDFPDRQTRSGSTHGRLGTSIQLDRLWGKGYTTVGDLTFESAAYVARYCVKKVLGPAAIEHYGRTDPWTGEWSAVTPEYVTMSRGGRRAGPGGIAADWFKRFGNEVYPSDEVISRGHPAKPPRFYDKLFEANHPNELAELKEVRKRRMKAADNTPARLKVREQCALARLKNGNRSYET